MKAPLLIAYADDDLDDQLMFNEIIRILPMKAEPVFFTNGLSLFQSLGDEIALRDLPDCIVLDINMPIWDGIKTLQTIRSIAAYDRVPVMMFTTSDSIIERQRCLELGANAFLTKPISRSEYQLVAQEIIRLSN